MQVWRWGWFWACLEPLPTADTGELESRETVFGHSGGTGGGEGLDAVVNIPLPFVQCPGSSSALFQCPITRLPYCAFPANAVTDVLCCPLNVSPFIFLWIELICTSSVTLCIVIWTC